MLDCGNQLYGIKTLNALLKNLNYYKIAVNSEILFLHCGQLFIDSISDIKSKHYIKDYLNQLLIMCSAFIEQYYLQSTVDTSYCRLHKYDLIYFYAHNDLYEKIYDRINNLNLLLSEEKNELIENIRFRIIELFTMYNLNENIDCFWAKKRWLGRKSFRLDIKNEPVALLFLKMVEKNDVQNLSLYYRLCSEKNTANFAKILTILAVFNILHNGNKRKYVFDLDIKEDSTKNLFKESRFLEIKIQEDEIEEYYTFILDHYVKDNDSDSKRIYNFNPKFIFNKEVVDTYFTYLLLNIKNAKTKEDITKEKGYIINEILYDKIAAFATSNRRIKVIPRKIKKHQIVNRNKTHNNLHWRSHYD